MRVRLARDHVVLELVGDFPVALEVLDDDLKRHVAIRSAALGHRRELGSHGFPRVERALQLRGVDFVLTTRPTTRGVVPPHAVDLRARTLVSKRDLGESVEHLAVDFDDDRTPRVFVSVDANRIGHGYTACSAGFSKPISMSKPSGYASGTRRACTVIRFVERTLSVRETTTLTALALGFAKSTVRSRAMAPRSISTASVSRMKPVFGFTRTGLCSRCSK